MVSAFFTGTVISNLSAASQSLSDSSAALMNSWAPYALLVQERNMRCNMDSRVRPIGARRACGSFPGGEGAPGAVFSFEADLPRMRQCFGRLFLQNVDQFFAHLAP